MDEFIRWLQEQPPGRRFGRDEAECPLASFHAERTGSRVLVFYNRICYQTGHWSGSDTLQMWERWYVSALPHCAVSASEALVLAYETARLLDHAY